MISSYFRRIANYSTIRFILEVTALAFVSRFLIVLPVVIILSLFGVDMGSPNIERLDLENNFTETVIFAVIVAPFVETLLFQLLPLKVLKFFRVPLYMAVFFTTLIFAYVHLDDGLINFIGMIPIGSLFVWSFVVREKKSLFNAIFSVFIIHSLTNLLATVIYLMGR